ncbi:uncharacterized protein [Diadema setosum]|uniref:uncharacterized protein n=1 Tax=Diadema setosum TaxID=31175 RepID=UPI003B3B1AF0
MAYPKMADSGRCEQISQNRFGVDKDSVVLLLAKALKEEDTEEFLEVYDNLLPNNLPSIQIDQLKEEARQISELPEKEFDVLITSLKANLSRHQTGLEEPCYHFSREEESAPCHMAATDAAVETHGRPHTSTLTTTPNDTDAQAKPGASCEATLRAASHVAREHSTDPCSDECVLSVGNEVTTAVVEMTREEVKGAESMNSHAADSCADSGHRASKRSDEEVGAFLSFGLKEQPVTRNVKDQPNLVQGNAEKKTNSPKMPLYKSSSSCSTEQNKSTLLKSAASILDGCKLPNSSTCPEPEYFSNHYDATALNVSDHRTLPEERTSKECVVERELLPLTPSSRRKEQPGEPGMQLLPNGISHKSYGSIDSTDATLPLPSVSSPEEDASPASAPAPASSTTDALEGPTAQTSQDTPEETTKKKKKRKKKKKGTSEGDPGGANCSDHESKVLTSPGTSGAEDSSKPLTPVDVSKPVPPPKATPANGPSAPQSKTSVSSKNKKSDNRSDAHSKKQINNGKKPSGAVAEDSKSVVATERLSNKPTTVSNGPKKVDLSNEIDPRRTVDEVCHERKNTLKVESKKWNSKEDNTSSNESDNGLDIEKSSEDASLAASKDSSIDETYQDDDDSNGNEWQTYGQKRSKRRAYAAEDRNSFFPRPSYPDGYRRSYYSGPFDPQLRKSSSEPSGISKFNDVSDSKPIYRHSSFSRHSLSREEYHGFTQKPDSAPAVETIPKPPMPISENSYAAKLKSKPPIVPNGSSKKSQEGVGNVPDVQSASSKTEEGKPNIAGVSSLNKEEPKMAEEKPVEGESSKPCERNVNVSSSTTDMSGLAEGHGVMSSVPPSACGGISAATAAKSASLPRDMGRKPGTDVPKMDNTSADNVVQYLDLEDTYAARLKNSLSKPSDTKLSSRASSQHPEKLHGSECTKPPRSSKLESSHKAVSLDSAQPVPAVVPKKTGIASSKDKDNIRSVKSETSLNLTCESTPVIQDNSFPFEAEPAASFDIIFGSVKFCESDFELIDEVVQSGQQPEPKSEAESTADFVPPNKPVIPRTQTSPSAGKQVSCEELEKAWIAKSPLSETKAGDQSKKPSTNNTSTVPLVGSNLVAILSGGKTNNTPPLKRNHTSNMKGSGIDMVPGSVVQKESSSTLRNQRPHWSAGFNHTELADMLLKDWEKLNSELTNQSSHVVFYEED